MGLSLNIAQGMGAKRDKQSNVNLVCMYMQSYIGNKKVSHFYLEDGKGVHAGGVMKMICFSNYNQKLPSK